MTKNTIKQDTYDELQLVQSQSFTPNLYKQQSRSQSKQKSLFIAIALISASLIVLVCVFFGKNLKLFSSNSFEQIYDLVTFKSTTALCLDGSPASYLVSRNGDPSKILIFFPPGAWCAQKNYDSTVQSFYLRSKTSRGSSKFLPKSASMQFGILSNHPNNYFKDWKKVYFHYCDGSGFQGTRKNPIQYKDQLLYFRGHNITVERLKDLEEKLGLFTKSSQVVVSGQSAGGLAVLMWSNYISERVQKGKVRALADASIFYDTQQTNTGFHLLKQQFKSMMNLTNAQINPPTQDCLIENANERQKCMFAQYIIKHIKVPLFLTQSLYDSYFLRNVMGLSCFERTMTKCEDKDKQIIEKNRLNVLEILQQVAKNISNGVWGIACVRHETFSRPEYFDQRYAVPQNSTITMSKAIEDWMTGSSSFHLDTDPWPANQPCS